MDYWWVEKQVYEKYVPETRQDTGCYIITKNVEGRINNTVTTPL